MSDSEDQIDIPDEGGDDLFGDEEFPDDAQSNQGRAASDEDQDEDQDEDRRPARRQYDDDDDAMRMDDEDQEVQQRTVMNVGMYRHHTPKSNNGQVQSMRVPRFLKIMAEEYKPDTFEPSQWESENIRSENPKACIRYQRDEQTGQLKSNALIYRWSDGSVTMAVGGEHYEIQKKEMVPPAGGPYDERQDSHYYVASANLASNLLLTVGHVSEQYTVKASKNMQDEALAKFANDMAAAARGRRGNAGDMIITATKDPELQKKEAEMAEKERIKMDRKRATAAANMPRAKFGGGLSVGDLEGGRKLGGGRKRGAPGASRQKRRRPEYDSDDDLPAGARKGDDYDVEDDFIAPSDDDMSGGGDEDEEEDILDDDDEDDEEDRRAPRKKRQRTAEAEDEDADADADADDEPAHEASRGGRRRHIIDEDDDDDE